MPQQQLKIMSSELRGALVGKVVYMLSSLFEDNRNGSVPIARFLVHFTWLHQVSFQHFLRKDACWSACLFKKQCYINHVASQQMCPDRRATVIMYNYHSLFVFLYLNISTKSVNLVCTQSVRIDIGICVFLFVQSILILCYSTFKLY